MLDGPLREQMISPASVLLPENLWPPVPPTAKVWVQTEEEYLEVCRGCAEMGLFTFLRSRDVLQAHGQPVPNGLMEVQKKDSVLPNGPPILRMITNAIPANAYQELLSGDIAKLPYFAQWNGIQLDREDLVVSWSEADMSAACWGIPLGTKLVWHALAEPVPGSFAAQWCPELASESLVCPAVAAIMMGWKSACGVLQHAHRRLCFAQPSTGAGLPTDSEVRRDRALPASGQLGPLVTIYLHGMSLAELSAVHQQAVEGTRSPEVAALEEVWSEWRIPSQEKKAVYRTDEWETLGCRVAGTLGVLARSSWRHQRTPWAHWVVLRCNSPQPQRVPDPGWQMVAVLSVPARSFLRFLTLVVRHLPQCTPTEAASGNCNGSVRYRVSPLVIPTDASESGFGVVVPPRSRLQGVTNCHCGRYQQPLPGDQPGIIELNAGIGGLRRSVELLERVPDVYAASENDPACFQVLETAWPTTVRLPQVAAVPFQRVRGLTIRPSSGRTRRILSSCGTDRESGSLGSTVRKDRSYGRQ